MLTDRFTEILELSVLIRVSSSSYQGVKPSLNSSRKQISFSLRWFRLVKAVNDARANKFEDLRRRWDFKSDETIILSFLFHWVLFIRLSNRRGIEYYAIEGVFRAWKRGREVGACTVERIESTDRSTSTNEIELKSSSRGNTMKLAGTFHFLSSARSVFLLPTLFYTFYCRGHAARTLIFRGSSQRRNFARKPCFVGTQSLNRFMNVCFLICSFCLNCTIGRERTVTS